ncbi:MAG: alpha/beta hydrolase, partial [Anaerolineae bacterium]|nr:alpha/beta hydrolase [Anaerolineae bacterium]
LGFTFYPILRAIVGTYLYFSANDGTAIRKMMLKDLSQVTLQSFFQSIGTLHRTDLTNQLHRIQQPVLGMYGKKDIIVRFNQHELVGQIENAQLSLYDNAGHFPMADNPERFVNELLAFLDAR